MSELPATCAVCGRRMPQRRAARASDVRKYCSAACRGQKLKKVDHALEEAIVRLLAACGRSETLCPSRALEEVFGPGQPSAQDAERVRRAARRLAAAGKLDILQQGRVVDGSTARGPILLRLR